MPGLTALLLLLAALTAARSPFMEPIECPLPGGNDSADLETCLQFSACSWNGSSCSLGVNVGYRLVQPAEVIHTGYELLLEQIDRRVSMFGEVERLRVTVVEYDDNRMALKYRDANADRYEVPVELDVPPLPTDPPANPQYSITLTGTETGDTFGVQVMHGQIPVLTSRSELLYGDQFIETTFLMEVVDLYGFGENNHDSFRYNIQAGDTWPLFAHDHGPGFEVENLYGVHPFFLGMEDGISGSSFGVLILNSNAMEYKLFVLDGYPALTYRTTGGILDMYLFFGDSPLEVLQQYHHTIGLPVMPPYWGLGFQLSRWGYKNVQEIRDVRERMKAAGIPQDVQYSDIDYMDGKRDFTLDSDNFGDLPAFIQELHEEGLRYVFIYDSAIAADFGTYATADRGVEQDVFIRWLNSSMVPDNQCSGCGDYVSGKVWPDGPTLYPNFFANRTVQWWTDEIRRFGETIGGLDGFWIDMNEPASFDTNIGRISHNSLRGGMQCPHTKLDYPPYPTSFTRSGFNPSGTVADHSICMSTVQDADLDGDSSTSYSHYDVHSLYGWSMCRATRAAVTATMGGRRSLIVSRSTYVGAGRWATHWTGDNTARWSDMKRSVIRILEFSMFGFPHVGADICGFNGDTTEQLCLRWTQLGAFYPFSRNHNTFGAIAQDPAVWPSVAAAARDALGLRYRLLPYLYTLFWRASEMGETVTRPLAFQFPSDGVRGVDTQFLWGDAIMVAPILEEASMTSVNVTFPAGEWYDLRNSQLAYNDSASSGTILYQVAMDEMIPVFARGGVVVPMQRNESTTVASRANPFWLAVFGSEATGMLFWDDGETTDTFKNGDFYHCLFHFSDNTLDMEVTHNDTQWMPEPTLSAISFFGVPSEPSSVSADGTPLPTDSVAYDEAKRLLTVQTRLDMAANHQILLHF